MTLDQCGYIRPLGQVALVGDPALVIGVHCIVDVRAPRHVGEDFKQIFQFIRRQRTVSILKQSLALIRDSFC